MKYCKLRIAWSVGWGIACMLLCTVWLREEFDTGLLASVPTAFPILFIIGLAVSPWIRWHFSLRTLLIVTTLIAMVLGLIVWAGRGER